MSKLVAPDILLLQPPLIGPYNFWKSECLGMGYLAAALEERGYRVHIIDAFLEELDVQDVVKFILEAPPRLLLGVSMLSYELFRSGDTIVRQLRDQGFTAHVTIGSWFPTFWYETIIDEGCPIDSVVLAEGERTICTLVNYLDAGRWINDYFLCRSERAGVMVLRQRETLEELDLLPHPRRDYLSYVLKGYHLATSYTARGCGHSNCTFCSVPTFYQGGSKHRMRSSGKVIEELAMLAARGADFLFFCDEDFIGLPPEGPRRALDIFRGAAERDISLRYAFNCTVRSIEEQLLRELSRLGLAAVYIGIESNLDRMLHLFAKGTRSSTLDRSISILKDLGIKLVPGWIMFERETTLDEVESQLKFLNTIGAYHVNYLKALYVMKDTRIEAEYDSYLYRTYYHNKYFFQDPNVDLLVRILTTDYLPEVMPCTVNIYPIWHKLLGGSGTSLQQQRFESINFRMRELSLGFTSEVISRIRSRSLNSLSRTLTDHVQSWRQVGDDIDSLAASLKNDSKYK